ncbi:hypothetical protein M23134_07907 [Microscilla marina ATCC 23134]|uniref:Uncharacterized protein n=1 Tax=Microscilla marina ATCC 23134 TaxID=313606 RepID=A1ZLQ5_MICM2|nr:hypothetical protein M23134_07907 [Microscilla marina ATCC 23134]
MKKYEYIKLKLRFLVFKHNHFHKSNLVVDIEGFYQKLCEIQTIILFLK